MGQTWHGAREKLNQHYVRCVVTWCLIHIVSSTVDITHIVRYKFMPHRDIAPCVDGKERVRERESE